MKNKHTTVKKWRFEVIIETERLSDAIEIMLDTFDEDPLDGEAFIARDKSYPFAYRLIWHDPYQTGEVEYGN
jgi:hypothetical protein